MLHFHRHYLKKTDSEIDQNLPVRCASVLTLINNHLAQHCYFVGEKLSLADIALVACTRFAHQVAIDLAQYPHVKNWLRHIKTDLNIEHAQ